MRILLIELEIRSTAISEKVGEKLACALQFLGKKLNEKIAERKVAHRSSPSLAEVVSQKELQEE